MFLLEEAALDAQRRGDDVIRLTLGISDLPLRTEIVDAIVRAGRNPVIARRVFPSGLPELREALARHFTEHTGFDVGAERVVVDAGSSSIYRNVLQILSEPGAEVLLPVPYYPLYRFAARLAQARCRYYHVSLETMQVDMASVRRGLTERTRLVVLNSPGNPLGNVVSGSALAEFTEAVPQHTHLLVDGVYDNVRFTDGPRLLAELTKSDLWQRERVIVLDSFSKGYRMYTRRVGWCILPPRLIGQMTVIQHHTRLTVDPTVQVGAVEALNYPEDVVALRETHRGRWERARSRLADVDGIRLLPTAGGFYCVLDCREFIARRGMSHCLRLAKDILEHAGVATVPGADFGLPGTLRLSFTNTRFDEAIERLHSYFSGTTKARPT